MYRKWALHWVVVDINPKISFAALNRRRREKTSEGKWAIDWAAECNTYQRLSWERSFSHLWAFTRRSNSRVGSSAGGGPGVGEGGGGGVLELIFPGYVPLASQNPYTLIVSPTRGHIINLILVSLRKT